MSTEAKNRAMDSRGMALVTVLLLTLMIASVIVGAITILMKETQVSTMFRTYRTAMEAAEGALVLFAKEFLPTELSGQGVSPTGNYGGIVNYNTGDCLSNKCQSATDDWDSQCSRTLAPAEVPDLNLTFSQYRAFLKITDTLVGNSDRSGFALEGMGVVEAGSGAISPQHFPYIYRVDVLAEKATASPQDLTLAEKAILNAVFAY